MSDMIILFILNYLSPQVVCGDTVSVVVTVQRESDEEEEDEAEDKDSTVGRVVCPRYGLEKTEAYWLVIGDSNSNALLSIKRITIGEKPSKVLTTALIAHSVEPH
jgi:pre-mRNA-splicing helicase BRR2